MYSITFRFEESDRDPITIDNIKPDNSILEVALQNNLPLNHNCGGVCICGTCHVYINKGEEYLEELSNKEEDLIDRADDLRLNSRLACQAVFVDGDGEIDVTLPQQAQFP